MTSSQFTAALTAANQQEETKMTNIHDYQAGKVARACTTSQMQAVFPYLVPSAVSSLIAAAKNIRIELKRAFPSVKFSVRSSRFSGGDAIDVEWTDGPTSAQVDQIINKYKAGSFDGMTDCYDYERSSWTDAFGSAKYVMSHRRYSDKAVCSVIRTVCSRYTAEPKDLTVESYRKGSIDQRWSTIVHRELGKRTWALSKAAA